MNHPDVLAVIHVYSRFAELKELSDRVNIFSGRCKDLNEELDSAENNSMLIFAHLIAKKTAAINRLKLEVDIYEHELSYARSEIGALLAKLP